MTGSSLLFPASLRTLLEMAPLGSWGLPTALLALLCCSGFGEETFEVYMWPKQVVVERGGLQKINCSTSCLKPESGGLETSLDKTLLDEHVQWKQFLITNISKDMVVLCYFTCSGKQVSSTVNVSVFHAPVLLKLQPTWVTVGRTFTIECRVPALSPLEKLTLTLLRGKEPLHIQTFGKATAVPQEAVATHNITAHREDGHHNFSCQAELDLRSLGGGVLRNVSKPQVVKIYEPKPDNQMVIIITAVSVLLFLFVTSVLLCFIFGQQWHQRRSGAYRVQAAWRRVLGLRRSYQAQPG